MSKRNAVAYIKPKDPSFLAKLKQDIGYKDMQPTIGTKKPRLKNVIDDEETENDVGERPEQDDERPQIVVVREGDMTAEQVANELQQQQQKLREREEAESRVADLQKPIVFRHRCERTGEGGEQRPTKPEKQDEDNRKRRTTQERSRRESGEKKVVDKEPKKINHSKLSFDFDEGEESDGKDN